MNKTLFSFLVIILSLVTLPRAFAAETTPLEPVSAMFTETRAATDVSSGFTVTGDGKLLSRPGPLFTEGGDYEGMQLPYLLSTPSPIRYPRWAMRQGWEGRFSLAIEILPNGTVGRTKVMQSTGHRLLDKVAESAVHSWKFHPAMKNGQPIVTCIQIPIVFQLEKE